LQQIEKFSLSLVSSILHLQH